MGLEFFSHFGTKAQGGPAFLKRTATGYTYNYNLTRTRTGSTSTQNGYDKTTYTGVETSGYTETVYNGVVTTQATCDYVFSQQFTGQSSCNPYNYGCYDGTNIKKTCTDEGGGTWTITYYNGVEGTEDVCNFVLGASSFKTSCSTLSPSCTDGAIKVTCSATTQCSWSSQGTTWVTSCSSSSPSCSQGATKITCTTHNITTCSWSSWSSWSSTGSCSPSTPSCSQGAVQRECDTGTACAWNAFSDWAEADECTAATPACSQGAVKIECQAT